MSDLPNFDSDPFKALAELREQIDDSVAPLMEDIDDVMEWVSADNIGKLFFKFRKGQIQNYKIIGLQEPTISYAAVEIVSAAEIHAISKKRADSDNAKLSVEDFDTTQHPDGAILRLKNETANLIRVYGCAIAGKAVVSLSNRAGYSTPYIEDLNSQYQDGVREVIVENKYIIDPQQIKDIADWYWKDIGIGISKKHIYVLSFPGKRFDFITGQRYTVAIGEAGDPEFFEADCQLVDVKIQGGTGYGSTTCTFREYQRAIPAIINPTVRLSANGSPARVARGGATRVVTAGDFSGDGDYLCSGEDDHVEIQAAIDELADIGGGTVQLTEGTYTLEDDIYVYGGVTLTGQGEGTVIDPETNTIILGNLQGQKDNAKLSRVHIKTSVNTDNTTILGNTSPHGDGSAKVTEIEAIKISTDAGVGYRGSIIISIDKCTNIDITECTFRSYPSPFVTVLFSSCGKVNGVNAENMTHNSAFTMISDSEEVSNVIVKNSTVSNFNPIDYIYKLIESSRDISNITVKDITIADTGFIPINSCQNISNVYIGDITITGSTAGIRAMLRDSRNISNTEVDTISGSGGITEGYTNCNNITTSRADSVTSSGNGYGFRNCNSMQQNVSVNNDTNYSSSYAGSTILTPVAGDTAAGGYNS